MEESSSHAVGFGCRHLNSVFASIRRAVAIPIVLSSISIAYYPIPKIASTSIKLALGLKVYTMSLFSRFKSKSVANAKTGDESPNVSIIIPVHNKENYIVETLDSVISQDLRSFEIICVDDDSSDSSLELITDFARKDRRIRVFSLAENRGAGHARNFGLDQARGKYVQFVDGDDLLAPGALKFLFQLAEETGSDLVRGGVAEFYKDRLASLEAIDIPPDRRCYRFRDEPALWIPWWHHTYVFSRKFLLANNIRYPEIVDGEDPVFLAACLVRASSISSTPFIVYHYRFHEIQARSDLPFLEHAELVRAILLAHEPRAWFEGYGKFLVENVIPYRLRHSKHAGEQLAIINDKVERLLRPFNRRLQDDDAL